jgi:hypothetical protein
MSDGEQIKPVRKTWVMLKKAVIIEDFNEWIIPEFPHDSATANSYEPTCDDGKYGAWKVSQEPASNGLYIMFDRQKYLPNGMGASLPATQYTKHYRTIYLYVPEGYSICPSKFYMYGYYICKPTIYGYDEKNNVYDLLYTGAQNGTFNSELPITTEKFYTKFKIDVESVSSGSYKSGGIRELNISAGKIKKG